MPTKARLIKNEMTKFDRASLHNTKEHGLREIQQKKTYLGSFAATFVCEPDPKVQSHLYGNTKTYDGFDSIGSVFL